MESIEQIAGWVTDHESLLSGLAALLAIAAIFPAVIRPLWRRTHEPTPARKSTRSTTKVADRPRIAVFPFACSSNDPNATTEAEILQQEVTTLLARSPGCDVISRWAANTYAAEGGDSAQAREDLEVRYVVEGQLRSTANGFRVTASLIDTEESRVTWSETFEASREPDSSLSQTLAQRIASHLGIEIARAEIGRVKTRPRSREARDLVLMAQGVLFAEGHHRHTYERAVELLERAIAKDPEFAEAYGLLSLLYGLGGVFGFFAHDEAFRAKVLAICRRALELDDRTSEVLGYVGCAYCDLDQYEQGIPLLERAVTLNPSNAQAKAALGSGYSGMNRLEEAVAMIESALDISPAYKGIAAWATVLAGSYLRLGRREEAASTVERALRCDPTFFPAHLVAALIALTRGDEVSARRHVVEAYRIQPDLGDYALDSLVGQLGAQAIGQLQAVEPGA